MKTTRHAKTIKISRHVAEPTQAEKIAECKSNIDWWTARAAYWQQVGNVDEQEKCARIANRAFEDMGRIQAGLL